MPGRFQYGTNIVGGVKPGGSGEHLGFRTPAVQRGEAVEASFPHAEKAIEAIEAEIL